MTQTVTKNLTSGDSPPVNVVTSQYTLAVGGVFDGATVTIKINVGPATAVPVKDASYTEPTSEVLWLPDCTAFVSIADAGDDTNINVALAPLTSRLK